MVEPAIFVGGDVGFHNKDIEKTKKRIETGKAYKDASVVCVVPTRGVIPARVVESWMNLVPLMNQKFVRIFVQGMEVGDAYDKAVEVILDHPELKKFKYMLTLEEDNMPPPDGLHRLLETICDCPKVCKEHFAQVAGLYFTKGVGGQPMIYGNPKGVMTFEPQIPQPDKIQETNGTGMGFTLFHMGLFKDKKVTRPWFKTVQEVGPGGNVAVGTQDLYFMGNIRRLGYRIASDNRVKVGHYDIEENIVW